MKAKGALLEAAGLTVRAPGGRPLFEALQLKVSEERIALIGRNGSGKSTLLEVLAGRREPDGGTIIRRAEPLLVPQELRGEDWVAHHGGWRFFEEARAAGLSAIARDTALETLSRGELRKLALVSARIARPELLLLDEPTEDLDARGIAWLVDWLARTSPLIVASHDRALLATFRCFFIIAESGCRCFEGSFEALEAELERERAASEERYARNLHLLVDRERDNARFAARRQRKKNRGRVNELDRCPSRAALNRKRSYAQEKQARIANGRLARIAALRAWAKSTRRALSVALPLELTAPVLPDDDGRELIRLDRVSMTRGGRTLFHDLNLVAGRRARIGVVGPNGAGKTTLLQLLLGRERPTEGVVRVAPVPIGAIAQGAADWIGEESLLSRLALESTSTSTSSSPAAIGELLVAHKFPLALAERPLSSLSPGERLRAALICCWRRTPPVELLVLDEPSSSLDLLGAGALAASLRAWPGALVIASHDPQFLERAGVDTVLELQRMPRRSALVSTGGP